MCLQHKLTQLTRADWKKSPSSVRRRPHRPDSPRLTPLTVWLMRAKLGQVLCSGSSTVFVHSSRRQALCAQKRRLLAPHQLMASSRGCPHAGQLGLTKANVEAEAQACSLDGNQVEGFPYFTSLEAAATPRFHLEEN